MGHLIATGGPNIFLASMWRSGSTHIAHCMCRLFNFRPATTAGRHGEGSEQQNINFSSAMLLFPYGQQVFQQHIWASSINSAILRAHDIHPIVITRDFKDVILSIKENIERPDTYVIPGMEIPNEWNFLSDYQKFDWLVTHALPWILQFHWSWKVSNLETMTMSYERFYKDQISGCKEIAKWVGLSLPEDSIIEFVCGLESNKMVGESGRGAKLIPNPCLDRIDEMVEKERKVWGG